MSDVFVGDNDHGDAVPPTDVLLQMIKLLREDVVHLAAELDTAQSLNWRILSEINCRIEHGADSNGHLEGIYGLFKQKDTAEHDKAVAKSYEKIATKYHATLEKLAQEEKENTNEN